jgi:hypothetical protein
MRNDGGAGTCLYVKEFRNRQYRLGDEVTALSRSAPRPVGWRGWAEGTYRQGREGVGVHIVWSIALGVGHVIRDRFVGGPVHHEADVSPACDKGTFWICPFAPIRHRVIEVRRKHPTLSQQPNEGVVRRRVVACRGVAGLATDYVNSDLVYSEVVEGCLAGLKDRNG